MGEILSYGMNKHIIILLIFSGFAFGQATNPCEDERYLEIKKKTLDKTLDIPSAIPAVPNALDCNKSLRLIFLAGIIYTPHF
jgi:hypothetical protein